MVNLGSPKSKEPKDVKTYLGEFLMDERVIDVPKILRTILVKGIVLNTRPRNQQRHMPKFGGMRGLLLLSYPSAYEVV